MSDMTPDPSIASKKTRRRIWPRVLLVVSLGVNLLVLGLVVGTALRFGGPERFRPSAPTLGMAVVRELPPEARRAFVRGIRMASGDQRTAQRQNTEEFIGLLRADRFDSIAAQEVIARQSKARARTERRLRHSLVQHLSDMTPQARAEYADRLESALQRHKKGKDHRPTGN